MTKSYDVIVAGAGPGGSSAAALLAKKGYKVLLLDKAKFPRDKTCGDAISGLLKVHEELGLSKKVKSGPHGEVKSITFSSPEGITLTIPFHGTGFVCRRYIYDKFIFDKAKELGVTTIENFTVTDIIKDGNYVVGLKGKDKTGKEKEFKSKLIIGADGALSVIARKTGCLDLDPKHVITSVRCYYQGIKDLKNGIEIHFVDSMIPGYFWIFPEENGKANVGVGMTQEDFKSKNWKMTDKMFEIIKEHRLFKERFKDAKLEEGSVRGWTLPVGSKRRKAHGNGFMLIGDAAGLIDAFTGEGISHAMLSGSMAATWADKAIKANDYSEKFLKQYEDELWSGEVGDKLRTAAKLQSLIKYKFLTNMLLRKAKRSKFVRDALREMMDNMERRKDLMNPMFYLRVLFA